MDLDLSTGRRAVLLGGTGVLAAAFLAACGDDSGSSTTTVPPTTAPPAADPAVDLKLSLTLASLEVLAIDTYQSILNTGPLTTPTVLAAAKLFQSHHEQHLDSINGDVVGGGDKEVTARNDAVYDELVKPKLAAATSEGAAVELLAELEHALAQTYTWSCSGEKAAFTSPDTRKKASTIAGIDARHVAVLQVVGTGAAPASVFPADGFFPGTNPLADIDGAMDTQ